jgi:phage terminase large subunit-like protein
MTLQLELLLLKRLRAKKLQRQSRTRLFQYKPYSKQIEFHRAGAVYRERLFMAGNQLGKTLAGAAEAAMHLTGEYAPDWEGHRFTKPVTMLAGSESYELTRDGVQRLLVGPPAIEEEWGTGMIPWASLGDTARRAGLSNALETISVKHISGGNSQCLFKAYEQGRGKWQANTVDYVWFDEEPPEDVYFEGLTRTNATKGIVAVTFTPLKGVSSVVGRYILEASPDRHVTTMTIDDAAHISPEERQKIINSYPAHEREARTKGIPSLGSGRIFPVTEESIVCEPFEIPKTWAQIGGMDFGWDHPFGAVKCAWDRDSDTFYVTACYRQREATPIIHAAALRPWGDWLPWAWPHDGLQHSKDSGEQLSVQYKAQKLKMLDERATFNDETSGVEAGLSDMLQRMETGRWKVFTGCREWLEEFRLYHRKDGKVVKERDDVICASRYALMMKRFAKTNVALKPIKYPERSGIV